MAPRYEILSDEKTGTVKRSVNIRIQDRITRDEISEIADEIHAADAGTYDRTFIGIYLPHQQDLTAGCWGTAHSNSQPEIKILGMTVECAAKFTAAEPTEGHNVVGRWIDDAPHVARAITIYESESNYFINCRYSDGSECTNEMNMTENGGDRKFHRNVESDSNDFWLVLADGSLEIRDNDGVISTPQKVG